MAKKIGPGKSNLNDNLKDSVFEKDIWLEQSDSTNWENGDVNDLVNNLHTVITNSTEDNPKTILVHLKRTTPLMAIGLGSFSGNFSNVKIIGLTSGQVEFVLFDISGDDTKRSTLTVFTPAVGLNAIRLEFHTTDDVSLSNLYIPIALTGIMRMQGQKPNGDFVEFQATNGGNFKVSLEELENLISVNNNSQLKTTSFDSSGNEGQTLIGTDYVVGKSGIDAVTEAQESISVEHHEIHEGNHFNYCDYALAQAAAVVIEFVLTVPDSTKWPHLTFGVTASEGATIELFEGVTNITNGASITPRNNNRNSATVSNVTILKDPTTVTPTIRAAGFLAGGAREAGITNRDKENILKQDEKYLVRITSLAAQNDISWCAEWYEHTNKN